MDRGLRPSHTDEHFQSTEVAAADVLGVSTTHPWEFISESPARSAVGPALACGAPYWLLRSVLYVDWLWGRALHAAMEGYSAGGGCRGNGLRESFAAILDVVYGINARLVLASCWPVLTMQMRPFSNSLEVGLCQQNSFDPWL